MRWRKSRKKRKNARKEQDDIENTKTKQAEIIHEKEFKESGEDIPNEMEQMEPEKRKEKAKQLDENNKEKEEIAPDIKKIFSFFLPQVVTTTDCFCSYCRSVLCYIELYISLYLLMCRPTLLYPLWSWFDDILYSDLNGEEGKKATGLNPANRDKCQRRDNYRNDNRRRYEQEVMTCVGMTDVLQITNNRQPRFDYRDNRDNRNWSGGTNYRCGADSSQRDFRHGRNSDDVKEH
uniref:Uncharacterized protein n=1 Tax=Glossina pallidipes TaxID=7398 RepID=A0A1B0AII5_GLOPL